MLVVHWLVILSPHTLLFTAQHLHLHAGGAGGVGAPAAAGTAVNTTVGGVTQINTATVKQPGMCDLISLSYLQ